MKKLILSAMALFAMTSINAQSIVFEIGGQEYQSGSSYVKEVKFTQESPSYEKNGEVFFKIKNVTANEVTFKFKNAGDVIESMEGYTRQAEICTDMCYSGDDIPEFTIAANSYLQSWGMDANCSLHMNNKEGLLGEVKAYYEVVNQNDASDVYTLNVTYKFIDNSGICDVTTVNNMFVSQTGNGQVAFNYSFKSAQTRILSIINVTGQVVARYQIDNAEGTFDVPANLAKGMYIYSVEEAGKKVAAHKFVVK